MCIPETKIIRIHLDPAATLYFSMPLVDNNQVRVMATKERLYSVKELSEIAGVSVRTLHYYDEIGLLKAKRNPVNGYRRYHARDAVFLQQVLFYRSMDMPLEQIKAMMTAADFDLMDALKSQHSLLLQRQSDTQSMLDNIEVAMSTLRGEKNIDIMFKSISPEKAEHWKNGLKEQGGEKILQAYGRWTEEQANREADISEEWIKRYAGLFEQAIDEPIVQELVAELYIISNRGLKTVSPPGQTYQMDYQRFLQTAELNKSNKVVREMYNHYKDGLADHLYEAMIFFAENSLKGNEAEWVKKTSLDS